ncbi:hypothetical protein ACNOYE_19270 [Nannocystaceae bacterium ST9]
MKHDVLRKVVVALVLYGAPLGLVFASSPAAAGQPQPDTAMPTAWLDAAESIRGLSGYALLERLETIAASTEFWAGFRSLLARFVHERPEDMGDFMNESEGLELFHGPGIPSRVQARAYYATLSVFTLIPEDEWGAAMKALDGDLEQHAFDFDMRWHDPSIPVEIHSLGRRASRGVVALMLKALSNDLDEATTTELLTIYAEGMESMAQLVGLRDDVDASQAAKLLDELRLPRLDRRELDDLTRRAAEAREILASTAIHLDGKPLELPPDPSFRP